LQHAQDRSNIAGEFFYTFVRPRYIAACRMHMIYISYSRAVPA
jgi:hypothetical protein